MKGFLIKSTNVPKDNVVESAEKSLLYLKNKVLERKKHEIKERMEILSRSSLPQDKIELEELVKQKMEVDSKIQSMKG